MVSSSALKKSWKPKITFSSFHWTFTGAKIRSTFSSPQWKQRFSRALFCSRWGLEPILSAVVKWSQRFQTFSRVARKVVWSVAKIWSSKSYISVWKNKRNNSIEADNSIYLYLMTVTRTKLVFLFLDRFWNFWLAVQLNPTICLYTV